MNKKKKSTATTTKKYVDGEKMNLFKNLVESQKSVVSKKSLLKTTRKTTKNTRKVVAASSNAVGTERDPIVFDSAMRKTFLKGVLQAIKEYFESKTDGKVEVSYEDYVIGSHEFGFKLKIKRSIDCSKQLFSEVRSAICNVVNYMLPADEFEKFDLTIFTEDGLLEFEILSNW